VATAAVAPALVFFSSAGSSEVSHAAPKATAPIVTRQQLANLIFVMVRSVLEGGAVLDVDTEALAGAVAPVLDRAVGIDPCNRVDDRLRRIRERAAVEIARVVAGCACDPVVGRAGIRRPRRRAQRAEDEVLRPTEEPSVVNRSDDDGSRPVVVLDADGLVEA